MRTDIVQLHWPIDSVNLHLLDNLPIWCGLQRWLVHQCSKLATSLPQAGAMAFALALNCGLQQPGSSTLCNMGLQGSSYSNLLGGHGWCSFLGGHHTKGGPQVWQEGQMCGKPTQMHTKSVASLHQRTTTGVASLHMVVNHFWAKTFTHTYEHL